MAALLAVLARDALVCGRVVRVAGRLGLQAMQVQVASGETSEHAPAGLLVELELDGAIDALARWRMAHPQLVIVAFLSTPESALWHEGERAGADLVTTRGRADRELERLVTDHLSGARRNRRVRLAPEQDFAGRLGFVGTVEDTPLGPVSVFHLGGQLTAIVDACPHAGASLCEGELDGDVITCPRHGSQFRVTDGARVRGPADEGAVSIRTVIEAGDVFLEFEMGSHR